MTESAPITQPDQIEADMAANRERLGASVEELVDKFNIPGQARQKAQQVTGQPKQATASLVDRLKDLPPAVLLASGSGLAALILLVITRRRR